MSIHDVHNKCGVLLSSCMRIYAFDVNVKRVCCNLSRMNRIEYGRFSHLLLIDNLHVAGAYNFYGVNLSNECFFSLVYTQYLYITTIHTYPLRTHTLTNGIVNCNQHNQIVCRSIQHGHTMETNKQFR